MDGFRARLPSLKLGFLSYWDLYAEDQPMDVLESGILPGHAGEFETSVMLYVDSKKVRVDQIVDEKARLASSEKGRILVETAAAALADYIELFAHDEEGEVEMKSWVDGKILRGPRWYPFVSRGKPLPNENPDWKSHPTDRYD
jgi:creatinine amidohydrolase/Fe(II)-dependent formamide hydrolase-like protein